MNATEWADASVYETIRQWILEGRFHSGEHLVEADMARLTNSSRTPVREALRRLAGEGLVSTGPTGRTRVSDFNDAEMRAIYEIRVRLESFAAGLAAQKCTDEDIETLRGINANIECLGSAVNAPNLREFYELNLQFHRKIVSMSGSSQLELALAIPLTTPIALLKHHMRQDRVDIELSCRQHAELLLAISSGNERWASACMAAHIETSRPAGAR